MKINNFLKILNDFLNVYIINIKGLSYNTQRSYKFTFKLLLNYFYTKKQVSSKQISFKILTLEVLLDFLDWLEKERECSVSTRNQRLAALAAFSKYSQNRDIDASTTFRLAILSIPKKKTVNKMIAHFTIEEIKIFLSLPSHNNKIGLRDLSILSFMYATGARAQEVCDLKIKDISFSENEAIVILTGKGNKSRRITISKSAASILASYLKRNHMMNKYDKYVFSTITREHMSISCIKEIFKKYLKQAKEEHLSLFQNNYSPHSMRHTTATHMLEAGVPLIIIKNFLGHESLQSTEIYAKVTPQTLERGIKNWNETWLHYKDENLNDKDNIPRFLK